MRKMCLLQITVLLSPFVFSSCEKKKNQINVRNKNNDKKAIERYKAILNIFNNSKTRKILNSGIEILEKENVDSEVIVEAIDILETVKKRSEIEVISNDFFCALSQAVVDMLSQYGNNANKSLIDDGNKKFLIDVDQIWGAKTMKSSIKNAFKECAQLLKKTKIKEEIRDVVQNYIDQVTQLKIENFKKIDKNIIEQKFDDIDKIFCCEDVPIDKIAKVVLKGVARFSSYDETKGRVLNLYNYFFKRKGQFIEENELKKDIQNINRQIIEIYKQLVKATVEKNFSNYIESHKQTFETIFFLNENDELDNTLDNFYASYVRSFVNFHHLYSFEFSEQGELLFTLKNVFREGGEFFKIETSIPDSSILQIDTSTGFNLLCIKGQEKGTAPQIDYLDSNEPFYEFINTLCMQLSAGFAVKNKNDKILDRSTACNAAHLFKNIDQKNFQKKEKTVDYEGKEFQFQGSFKDDGYKHIGNIHYGYVSCLFSEFYEILKKIGNSKDNKERFESLYSMRNIVHYIYTSTLDGNLLLQGNKKLEGRFGELCVQINTRVQDFWRSIDKDKNSIKLALAEYLIKRCGLFDDNIHLNKTAEKSVIIDKNYYGNEGMKISNRNTYGIWKNLSYIYSQELCKMNDIDLNFDNLFSIGTSISDSFLEMWNVINCYINDNDANYLADFLEKRDEFFSTYKDGIYGISNFIDFINFYTKIYEVAQAADNIVLPDGLFKKLILPIISSTFKTSINDVSPMMLFTETCFANSGNLKEHIFAYLFKFFKNLYTGKITVNGNKVGISTDGIDIKSVKDVKPEFFKKFLSFKNNVTYKEINGKKEEHDEIKPYVHEGELGLISMLANIYQKGNLEKNLEPKINAIDRLKEIRDKNFLTIYSLNEEILGEEETYNFKFYCNTSVPYGSLQTFQTNHIDEYIFFLRTIKVKNCNYAEYTEVKDESVIKSIIKKSIFSLELERTKDFQTQAKNLEQDLKFIKEITGYDVQDIKDLVSFDFPGEVKHLELKPEMCYFWWPEGHIKKGNNYYSVYDPDCSSLKVIFHQQIMNSCVLCDGQNSSLKE